MTVTEQQRKLNDERVKQDIREFGCHVISVIDPDEREPSFTYSVGVKQSIGAPDAIVFGVRPDLGAWLVNEYKRQVQQGARFVRGTPYEGFLDGFTVYVEPVRRKRAYEFTLGCTRYYGSEEYEVVQIVYPTVEGVWPWQQAASERFVANQPMLGRLRPDRP